MKKIFIMMSLIILTGCASKDLNEGYNNMQVNKDNINGYNLDLKIEGSLNRIKLDALVSIKNYNNEQYEIIVQKVNQGIDENQFESTEIGSESEEQLVNINEDEVKGSIGEAPSTIYQNPIYIYDSKIYTKNYGELYKIETNNVKYTHSTIYLECLTNMSKSKNEGQEKIGNYSYTKYSMAINRETIVSILKDIGYQTITDETMDATVYLDKEKRVYEIVYHIDKLTITASYYNINQATPIDYPAGIK